MQMIVVLTTSP